MPKPETHDIRIRVTDDQHALFIAAAEAAGMTLSAWMRMMAVKEARKQEKKNA